MPYRHAHVWFFIVLGLAFLGFFPSYFSRLPNASPAQHFHAVTALLWMIMLISQSWSISHGKVWWHRTAGKLSYFLAPIFISSAFLIIQAMLLGAGPFRDAFGAPLGFVDLIAIGVFAWLYHTAIRHRRNTPIHARAMSATVLMLLGPIVTRVFGFYVPHMDTFTINMHAGNALIILIVAVLLYRDRQTVGVTLPYMVTGIAVALQSIGFELLRDAAWWKNALTATADLHASIVLLAGLFCGGAVTISALTAAQPERTKTTP